MCYCACMQKQRNGAVLGYAVIFPFLLLNWVSQGRNYTTIQPCRFSPHQRAPDLDTQVGAADPKLCYQVPVTMPAHGSFSTQLGKTRARDLVPQDPVNPALCTHGKLERGTSSHDSVRPCSSLYKLIPRTAGGQSSRRLPRIPSDTCSHSPGDSPGEWLRRPPTCPMCWSLSCPRQAQSPGPQENGPLCPPGNPRGARPRCPSSPHPCSRK